MSGKFLNWLFWILDHPKVTSGVAQMFALSHLRVCCLVTLVAVTGCKERPSESVVKHDAGISVRGRL